ncbi:MAG: hypothetical protein UY41_C0018G0004 [Candidatus Moranbacteria bacterium GW2011_GWE1_49_15]|nr:MAG: hypothetical protein UX75_C0051G0006 [Candidatus Moranbacteria bacterium GW2011_GWE2_47_10]KKW06646.1 MAG: hypothetical protein UY41_C0018G0004 [Candidatus Moranbacteria bacterium GW2011_GWE1_49_15]HBP00698.1 hypothetical protein [Candidatus Moranbacteria bacterium]
MRIEVDYSPKSDKKEYFISVSLNDKESISFDHTYKGKRVTKQVLIEDISHEDAMEKYGPMTAEWETLIIEDSKYIGKYPVKWIDRDKFDTVNGETWETVWEKPISEEADEKLWHYARLISDNYENLNDYADEMKDFEKFVADELEKCK